MRNDSQIELLTPPTPGISYKQKLPADVMKELYRQILFPRMIEEKMLLLLRLGKVSKWFAGIGQEAISVGAANALYNDEYILPMHRNLGVFTSRNVPLAKLFKQLQGKYDGFSKGRERSFHFGTNEHHIVGMISHLGPQMAIADGIALACELRREKKATLVFTGDGGTSEGDFHEAMNVAAVWQLPVIFIIENNGYGLSTPVNEQYRCKDLYERAAGYGMQGIQIDGNNILEVYDTIKKLASKIRKNPEPVLVECLTFRMRGHEEASGVKYVPKELIEQWKIKDPVENYEKYMLATGILTKEEIYDIKKEYKHQIDEAWEEADTAQAPVPDTNAELNDVYAPHIQKVTHPDKSTMEEMRYIDAISNGLDLAMEKHRNLILMGQDIAEYGGVFKITEGLYNKYGSERVRNTPLCESAIIGAALGLSIKKVKSMVEMQFADFVTSGFNQIVNNLAKIHYRWGQNADVVIRMPAGAGVGAGPFHSQSNEAWFFHTPGLKVVYPSTPSDAKGLLLASFEDPNPVMFFEHKALYRKIKEKVPTGYYTIEIGKAKTIKEGSEVSIITYGLGAHWAVQISEELAIDADIIDLRSLLPIDEEAVFNSVKKTGKALVLHEDTLTGGIGGEIAARISESCFEHLDAPVMRCAGLDTPVPFAVELEENYFPKERFKKKLKELVDF